jgi:alkanesulfonate monooxygenase
MRLGRVRFFARGCDSKPRSPLRPPISLAIGRRQTWGHDFFDVPQSKDVAQTEYLRRVGAVAQWSEDAGCGVLVFTDNGLLDPWVVSHAILRETSTLCPLVALQPAYMHPYAAAKMVTSFAYLYGRRVFLNMVAGGFRNDLLALADETPHDERYERLSYTSRS